MDFFNNTKIDRIFDIVIVLILLLLCGFVCFFTIFKKNTIDNQISTDISLIDKIEDDESIGKESVIENLVIEDNNFTLDIKGAVKNPGVYVVKEGAVVNDIIKLAGGLKTNASTKYINLSKKVSDEMVITIYTESQIKEMKEPIKEECISNKVDFIDCKDVSIVTNDKADELKENDEKKELSKNNKVSINSATKEELMTLSGVGESKALAIIEYREKNDGFKTLEELMNVSGIGEAAYQKIKDNIKL